MPSDSPALADGGRRSRGARQKGPDSRDSLEALEALEALGVLGALGFQSISAGLIDRSSTTASVGMSTANRTVAATDVVVM